MTTQMDPLTRLRNEIHLESARIAPQTSGLIEAAKAYIEYVERERIMLKAHLEKHSELPCRVDEMNTRELEIYKLLTADRGMLLFLREAAMK